MYQIDISLLYIKMELMFLIVIFKFNVSDTIEIYIWGTTGNLVTVCD